MEKKAAMETTEKTLLSMPYPWMSISVAGLAILISPFFSAFLAVGALAICLYRIFRYDEKIFSVDYCLLLPLELIFRIQDGVSFLLYLSVMAIVWYLLKSYLELSISLILLLFTAAYLLLRTNGNYNNLILCISQLLLLWTLVQKQTAESAMQSAKAFCGSLMVSTAYALIFRHAWAIEKFKGQESDAYWGSDHKRFQGLFKDPNYYMALLIIALTLLICLYIYRYINKIVFLTGGLAYVAAGLITYSKTYLLVLTAVLLIYLVLQCRAGKWIRVFFIAASVAGIVTVSLQFSDSPISIIVYRFTSSANIDDLTTGRSVLYALYGDEIMRNSHTVFFGLGLDAPRIIGKDPHNLIIEIMYRCGVVGMGLFAAYFASLVWRWGNAEKASSKRDWLLRYYGIIVAVLLFSTLHGMFSMIVYGMWYLVILATLLQPPMGILKKQEGRVIEDA